MQRRHSTALTCTQSYKRGLKTCGCVRKSSSHKESRRWTVLASIIGVGSKLRVCGSAVVAAGSSQNRRNASIPTHTLGLHVCTSVQQHPHNVSIPPLSSKVQRTASLLGLIGRATNLHQRTTTQRWRSQCGRSLNRATNAKCRYLRTPCAVVNLLVRQQRSGEELMVPTPPPQAATGWGC